MKILKKTAPPPKHVNHNKYPFPYMKKNDCLEVSYDQYERVSRAAYSYAKFHGLQAIARTVLNDNNEKVGRIWLVPKGE